MSVSEMGRSFYIQTKETEDQTMATKKTAVIPEEEILAAATEENINEHALHQTETEPEPDRVLSAEGAPGDADLIDISVLHENLRLKRKERGLSQEELASRLHVVRQTISKWEKGVSHS